MAVNSLSDHFTRFFAKINPSSDFEATASRQYNTIKSLIEDRSGPVAALSPRCFLQGSYRQQTAIHSINDVDVVALCSLWFPGSGTGRGYSRDEIFTIIIAVPIRVLVHHVPEKKSACLLHQVDPGYWKKLIRFAPVISTPQRTLPSGVIEVSVSIPINMTMAAGKTSFTRYQKGQEPRAKVPLKNWWIDPCWDSGTNKVSNKDIVLAISNKEGGAHVDGDTTQKYRIAKSQGRLLIGGNPINDIARLGSLVGIAGDELLEYLDNQYPESV